jgi:hypothetical protein
MKTTIYGRATVYPINFPDEIEIRFHPMNPESGEGTGQVGAVSAHVSWASIRERYHYVGRAVLDECESRLKSGEEANLIQGYFAINLTLDKQDQK